MTELEKEYRAKEAVEWIKKCLNEIITMAKEAFQSMAIFIKQSLCRHEELVSFTPKTKFRRISGETIYICCTKCGKILDSISYDYEGFGYK